MNKSFCPLPWKEIASTPAGSVRLCCTARAGLSFSKYEDGTTAKMTDDFSESWNTTLFKTTREKMKAGLPVEACSTCYQQEDAGMKSPRLSWLERYPDMSIASLPTTVDVREVQQVDLRLGNVCNLRCRMCNPYSSSAWKNDWKSLDLLVEQPDAETWERLKKNAWTESPEFWDQLKALAPSLESVYLTGGEPLLVAQNKEFVRHCIASGEAAHIDLRYNTNGTIWDSEMIDLWKHFKSVTLSISIDALGELNDYIRYPSKWDQVLANLERFIEASNHSSIQVAISCTVQIFNIFQLPEVLDFFIEKNLPVFLNLLQQPSFLSIGVLSQEHASLAREGLQRHKDYHGVAGILEILNASGHAEWDKFVAYSKKLDQIRQQNFSDYVDVIKI